jgi:hypothetical protein
MLQGLRAKYVEMLALRVEHAAGADAAPDVLRRRMADLAATYPGALREIDDLEIQEIRRRVGALDDVLHRRQQAEPWMETMGLFHALARGALAAKRWLRGRKRVDATTRARFLEASGGMPFPDDARHWADHLARIASPPGGRVTAAVFARVSEVTGIDERSARRLVFGEPRRERGKS